MYKYKYLKYKNKYLNLKMCQNGGKKELLWCFLRKLCYVDVYSKIEDFRNTTSTTVKP